MATIKTLRDRFETVIEDNGTFQSFINKLEDINDSPDVKYPAIAWNSPTKTSNNFRSNTGFWSAYVVEVFLLEHDSIGTTKDIEEVQATLETAFTKMMRDEFATNNIVLGDVDIITEYYEKAHNDNLIGLKVTQTIRVFDCYA